MPISSQGSDAPIVIVEDLYKQDNPVRINNRSFELAPFVERDPQVIGEQSFNGDKSSVVEAKTATQPSLQSTFSNLQQTNVMPAEAMRIMAEQAQKIAEVAGSDDLILEGALTYGDPNFSPTLVRSLVNEQIGMELLQDRLSKVQDESSTFGMVLDFADRYILRQTFGGFYEDITQRTSRKGEEILRAKLSMSPDEFVVYFNSYLDEVEQEGVLSGKGLFALMQAQEELESQGEDPLGSFKAVTGVVDIPFKGFAAAKAGRLLSRVSLFKGPEGSTSFYEKLKSLTSKQLDPEIEVEAGPRTLDTVTHPDAPKPSTDRVTRVAENGNLIDRVKYLTELNVFGKRASEEEIATLAAKVREDLEATVDTPIGEYTIQYGDLGEAFATFKLGKSTGDPYANKGLAQIKVNALTDRGVAATVEPVDPSNLKAGYYAVIKEPIDQRSVVKDYIHTTDLNNIFVRATSPLWSTRVFDDPYLNELAIRSVSGNAALNKSANEAIRKVERLHVDSQGTLSQIWSDLRDGPDSALRRVYSEADFRSKWVEKTGKVPTEKEYDAFVSVVDMHDTSYFLTAHDLSRRYTSAGYKTLVPENGEIVLAKKVDAVAEDATVTELRTGAKVKGMDIPEGQAVWADESGKLFTKPKSIRSVTYKDALPYNAGGNRVNPDARFFITLWDDANVSGNKAILTAFTEKQAKLATAQLDNIRQVFLRTGLKVKELTNELDEVILTNNYWNPNVTNTTEFVKFIGENTNFSKPLSYKPRDGIVVDAKNLWDGMSYDAFLRSKLKRSDEVLVSFGGDKTFNSSPIKDITEQLNNAMMSYSMRNYTEQALSSWVSKAFRKEGQEVPAQANMRGLFEAKMAELTRARVLTNADRRLLDVGRIIQRRLGETDRITKAFEDTGWQFKEFVFDKTGMKVPDISVQSGLLKAGFQSAFGFFNLSQFMIQSSQVAAIAAISPRHGFRASTIVPALRLALHNGHPEAVKRIAKVIGVSDSEAEDIFTYLRTSGRMDVESDALEKSIGPGLGYSGYEGQSLIPSTVRQGLYQTSRLGKGVLKAGVVPFTEGERLSRLTAATTAILEFKAKNHSLSILSDYGRQWITNREQALTFDMTVGSKAAIQQGIWRLPTQWTSYAFRAMEAVVIGSRKKGVEELTGLTGKERARLGVLLVAQGGLAGFGFSYAADVVGEQLGLDPKGVTLNSIKYGVYDSLFSYFFQGITGSEDLKTAMGTRLAPWTVFIDIYRKITEEAAWSTIGGPSTEIVWTAFDQSLKAIGNLLDGNSVSAWEDIQKVLRTASGINNIAVTRSILQEGVYRAKSGSKLPMEFDDADALLAALGFTNAKVVDYYNTRTGIWRDTKELKKFSKDILTDYNRALDYINAGDPDTGNALLKELKARIDTSGFSQVDKSQLYRSLRAETNQKLTDMVWYYLSRGKDYSAQRVAGLGE